MRATSRSRRKKGLRARFREPYEMRTGHRDVMGRPGIGGDFIFAIARIASGLRLHFQDDEIAKAFLMEAPCRGQPGNSSANDDDRDLLLFFWRRKSSMVTEPMPQRKTVVDKLSVDAFFGFGGETDEGGSTYSAEKSPSRRHFFSVIRKGRRCCAASF